MDSELKVGLNLSLQEQSSNVNEKVILDFLHIEASKHVLRSVSSVSRYAVSVFLIISLSVGTLFKFVLYRYVLKSSKMNNGSYFKMTPINSMIFTSALIHHLVHVYIGIFLVLSIGMDVIFADIFGHEFCYLTVFIGTFGLTHMVVSGAGMAIYRLFCIKNDVLVKGTLGEQCLFHMVYWGILVIALILTVMFNYERTADRVGMNFCTGNSEFVEQMWIDYDLSRGKQFASTKFYQISAISINLGITLTEIACYAIFFHHIFSNDNGSIKQFLPKDVTRQRNKRNAVSFIGHVYGFLIEFAFFVGTLIVLIISSPEVKYFGSVSKIMEFGVLSIIEVCTSEAMRNSISGNII